MDNLNKSWEMQKNIDKEYLSKINQENTSDYERRSEVSNVVEEIMNGGSPVISAFMSGEVKNFVNSLDNEEVAEFFKKEKSDRVEYIKGLLTKKAS